MEQDLVIRDYTEADKEGVFALKEAVDGVPFDEQYWNWKFEKGPLGPAKIYVAEISGTIVGIRALIIEGLKVMDESWKTGLGVDIMSHPDFRRYGIAGKVSAEAFTLMNGEGIQILVGFPNEAAFIVYKRRRPYWRHVCSPPILAKPLNTDSMFSKYIENAFLRNCTKLPAKLIYQAFLKGRLRKASDISIDRIQSFDERFDDFWPEASKGYNIGIVRDRGFLNWRFVDKPGEEYIIYAAEKGGRISGYIVLKNAEMFNLNLGLIVDMLTTTQADIIDSLISKAIEHFSEQNVDAVGCAMLNHTPYYKALKKAGFIPVPKALSHKEFYFGVQVKPSTLPDNIINNRANWFITWADMDIV